MTSYEHKLLVHLGREWDPKFRITMFSIKTDPLTDECKSAIVAHGASVGLRVEFPVEEVLGKQQHFVCAFSKAHPKAG